MRRNLRMLFVVGLSMVFMTLLACRENGENNGENKQNENDGHNPRGTEKSSAYTVRGVVWDVDGKPLKNVAVVANKATATSDEEGRYQIRLPEGEAVLKFSSSNHVGTLKKVTVSKEHATMLHVKLLKAAPMQPVNADNEGTIRGSSNKYGTQLLAQFPARAFVDANGDEVSGNVFARLTNIDPTDDDVRESTPGSFLAADEEGKVVQLESGGMLAIDVRDASGEKLQLAEDAKLKVWFPVAEGLVEAAEKLGENPPDMQLWSFDEVAGQWVWEGLTEFERGDNGELYYTAELPHMSTWNCDMPLEATCVMGCAKDKATGEPLAGAQVIVSGIDYIGNSQATTGADGCFRVAVRKNSQVQITVQHKLGGGLSRQFTSGNTSTPVPPTSSTTCANAGEFVVERDIFDYNGVPVDCAETMPSFSGNACMEELGEMFTCWRTAGACTINIGSSGETSMRWDSGARWELTSGTLSAYQHGQFCYSMEYDSSGLVIYKDAQGRTFKQTHEIRSNQYKYTLECPSGQAVEVSVENMAALSACQPQAGGGGVSERCTFEWWGSCSSANECEEGEICCEVSAISYSYCLNENDESYCTSNGGTPLR